MKRIFTLADLEESRGKVSPVLANHLERRFHQLVQFYEDGEDIEAFTLKSYGEIVLAESYEEISRLSFDEIIEEAVGDAVIYLCVHSLCSDLCIDVYVPEAILSEDQKQQLLG